MSRKIGLGDMVTIKGSGINKTFIIENILSDYDYFYLHIYDILDEDYKLMLYGSGIKWKIYGKNNLYLINFFDKVSIPNYQFYFAVGFPSINNIDPEESLVEKNEWKYDSYDYYLKIKKTYVIIKGKKILISKKYLDNNNETVNDQPKEESMTDESLGFFGQPPSNPTIDDIDLHKKYYLLEEIGIKIPVPQFFKIYKDNLSININNIIYDREKLNELILHNIENFWVEDATEDANFPKMDIIPKRDDQWCCILKLDDILIGYVYGNIRPGKDIYISDIEIHPQYQNKHLCVPLLKHTLKELIIRNFTKFYIINASYTRNGIPACLCYYKAPHSLGLIIKDQNGTELGSETCFKENFPRDLVYYK